MALQINTNRPDPALLDLPWATPLDHWDEAHLAALPRGLSRHVVRFVRLSGKVVAVKEIKADLARREYDLLRTLRRLEVPAVKPLAVIGGRVADGTGGADAGTELDACLLTRHLQFSLPYRALYSQRLRPDTSARLVDALAVLLVRLHLSGFWWGDVSLSNTLFRRDAGGFSAYLVDAETGQLFPSLSDGQRAHDLEIARINITDELMDLMAGNLLPEETDPIEVSQSLVDRYYELFDELTGVERFETGDRWRVDERIRRLNQLGFDVDELSMSTDLGGTTIAIQPKVVDAGHHSRRLLRLTGLDVQENQARRLLNDLDAFQAAEHRQADSEELVAHAWMSQVYEPVIRAIPAGLRNKLEPPQLFHEVLEHRWYMSERAGHDVSTEAALSDYLTHVLPGKPDEDSIVGVDTVELPVLASPQN
ncbi:MAG: DUF4032 domain-containing protein [Austwickia sp.]|nr:DUF4032 domain-containing protein [Austwickia sp.]